MVNEPGELPMPVTTDCNGLNTSEDHCNALWVATLPRMVEAVLTTVTNSIDSLDTQIVVHLVAQSRCNAKSRAASGKSPNDR